VGNEDAGGCRVNRKDELREILEWVHENPEPQRGPATQALFDVGTVLAWMFFGAVAFVAVFGSLLSLLFLLFFA
jgi:hypothetical protein